MDNLIYKLREFAADRDWDQFHSPIKLAMVLSVEAAEVEEHFQWLTKEQSYIDEPDKLYEIKQYEIRDVHNQINNLTLCNIIDNNPGCLY